MRFLAKRGWIACDDCKWRMLPLSVAYRRGWLCAGAAGFYDRCPHCLGNAPNDPKELHMPDEPKTSRVGPSVEIEAAAIAAGIGKRVDEL